MSNFHYTDKPPKEHFYFVDEAPSAPTSAPTSQATSTPSTSTISTSTNSTRKGKGKSMLLKLVLLIAILALVYGLYCLFKPHIGGKSNEESRFLYF